MIAEPKRETHHDDRDKRQRQRQEKALDDALKNTFPASDPVSVEQPASPAADHPRLRQGKDLSESNSNVPGKGRLAVRGGVLRKKGR